MQPETQPILSVRSVEKYFGDFQALHDINLDVYPGEIFALLGPSGCGKSTLLRIISGFETQTSGNLLLDGQDMSHLPPNKRPTNMVFQSYAVFPHMTVAKNVAYGLKMERLPKTEIQDKVAEALSQVHLQDFAGRMPEQLSGGQRQRVALARALVKRPRLLLLDEPLSALDAKLRDAMRLELVKLQESVGVTFIIVTHDQSEALAMADRVAVLNQGKLCQVDSPENLYQKPASSFVADFIGRINFFDPNSLQQASILPACKADEILALRPEAIEIGLEPAPKDKNICQLSAKLGDIAFQGQNSIVELLLPIAEGQEETKTVTALIGTKETETLQKCAKEAQVWLRWRCDDMLVLTRN